MPEYILKTREFSRFSSAAICSCVCVHMASLRLDLVAVGGVDELCRSAIAHH